MIVARDTAYMYGLYDRGTIEVGKKADLNIVDMEALKILGECSNGGLGLVTAARHSNGRPLLRTDPVHVYDMPTGAPRWDQKCEGYEVTIQTGVVTFLSGESTGALPGKLVRNPNTEVMTDLPECPMEFINYRRAIGDAEDGMDAEAQLQKSMEAESGISHQSRVTQAMEEEAKKNANAEQKSKL